MTCMYLMNRKLLARYALLKASCLSIYLSISSDQSLLHAKTAASSTLIPRNKEKKGGVKDTASPIRVFTFPSIHSILSFFSQHTRVDKKIDIRSDIQNQREILKDLDFRLLFLVFIWGVCMI